VLVGERPLYFNHVFQKSAERIGIVEGHADAVTLGQWGVAGIALGGLGACEQLRRVLCQEKRDAVQDGRVFLALDNDGPGREAVPALGNLLGGMLRILTMER
jgi:DNA primase